MMKDKILLFVIGVLVGAVIAIGAFFIYTKSSCSSNNGPGGNPPSMQNSENGEPPEMPNGENGGPPARPGENNTQTNTQSEQTSSN